MKSESDFVVPIQQTYRLYTANDDVVEAAKAVDVSATLNGTCDRIGNTGTQVVAFAENSRAELRLCGGDGAVAAQLTTGGGKPGQGQPCIAFGGNNTAGPIDVATAVNAHGGPAGRLDFESEAFVAQSWAVRRLTPRECERLQGFPDGYTDVPWRGKSSAPDGPRYKALGNSMACNVMRWLGRRIEMVNTL